ncbi:MAG: XdhC family protein [Pseudomonadota bacterium]
MLTSFLLDPIAGLSQTGGVLAVTTGVEGSAYRPMGAAMAFLSDGTRIGSLSSGCIEEALADEAGHALTEGSFRQVRYGEGSPWIDIKLPCGAGLDVSLWPTGRKGILSDSASQLAAREPHALHLPAGGLDDATTAPLAHAQWTDDVFVLPRIPPLRFLVIGTGLETILFAEMARASGYIADVVSPDPFVQAAMKGAAPLASDRLPPSTAIDQQTAVVFFFHEHTYETGLLQSALQSPAFWIGAQGSKRKRDLRQDELKAAGLDKIAVERIAPHFGTIPSARDPQTLAVSVLADVVGAYKAAWCDPYFGSVKA